MHEWLSEWTCNISNRGAELAFKNHQVSELIRLQFFFGSGKNQLSFPVYETVSLVQF